MSKPTKPSSPLVLAAAALDDALRGYDDLAEEAKRAKIHSAKTLERAVRIVQESTEGNEGVHEKLRELLAQIEAARLRQEQSLTTLLEAARHVQARSEQYDTLLKRFAALGESAREVNTLAAASETERKGGASPGEVAEALGKVDEAMARVVAEAEALAAVAAEQSWEDLKRQADAARQQVLTVNNKLAAARRSAAERAPS
jgi:hypothetical protein